MTIIEDAMRRPIASHGTRSPGAALRAGQIWNVEVEVESLSSFSLRWRHGPHNCLFFYPGRDRIYINIERGIGAKLGLCSAPAASRKMSIILSNFIIEDVILLLTILNVSSPRGILPLCLVVGIGPLNEDKLCGR